jgi:hypothetical protein
MGFLTNPKTGKRMTADEFIQREKKEWGEALKTFAKEIAGVGRKSGRTLLSNLDKEFIELIKDQRKRKRR